MTRTLDRKVIELTLGDTLPYELLQFEQSFIHLQWPKPEFDQSVINALIESFCIHARQLIDFFGNRGQVRAEQFLGGSYEPLHARTISRQFKDKLNDQIAHISEERTAVQSEKIGPADRQALLLAILPEATNFISKLTPADRALVTAKYRSSIVIQQPGAEAATTHGVVRGSCFAEQAFLAGPHVQVPQFKR